ncbi:hypothetical protein DFH27DRAFT_291544 [Peziza echinospora]|nr:hypothetical protein DFH27DRAFT_291544 [Peziza echinospora]
MQISYRSIALLIASTAMMFASESVALPVAGNTKNILGNLVDNLTPTCKLEKAILPLGTGTVKLSGAGSLALKLVVLGRGTQNYTCADSTENSKPVANGALATIYDASCFAVNAPAFLHILPQILLHTPNAIPYDVFPKIGTHFFHPDASTPVFDVVNPIVSTKSGLFVGKKAENIPAPTDANAGIAPDAYGAVDWLKLVPKEGVVTASGAKITSSGYAGVYRVHTAGGKAPENCAGRPAEFTVPYATEYWLYN